jgi:hypothetical protein
MKSLEWEVIEPETESTSLTVSLTPASLEANFDALEQKIRNEVSQFQDWVVTDDTLKVSKSVLAGLRRMSTELNNRRKAVKAEYKKPLDAFETRVNEIDAIIKSEIANIDNQVKVADEQATQARYDKLKEFYEDFAPLLVPVVPFSKLIDGEKWTLKSTGEKKAEELLIEKVKKIAEEHASLKALDLEYSADADLNTSKLIDLGGAISKNSMLVRERERIDTMNAEVTSNKAAQTPAAPVEQQQEKLAVEQPEIATETFTYQITVICTKEQIKTLTNTLSFHGINGTAVLVK